MKTGINIEKCKVGVAEKHNSRDEAYIAAVNASPNKKYSIFEDKTKTNVSWVNPDYENKTLPGLLDELRKIYRDNVGQAPQEEDRVRQITDKKTGMKRTVTNSGWSPIREGVCPILPTTTISDFNPFIRWLKKKGLQVVRLDLHHDEGHTDLETGERKYNHHAHIIIDWVDHSTGKTRKLSKIDTSEMQTQLANSLGMERGVSKTETGADHLTPDEQRAKAAAQELKNLQDKTEAAVQELQRIQNETDDAGQRLYHIQEETEGAAQELQRIQNETDNADQRLHQIQEETEAANKQLEEKRAEAQKEAQNLLQTQEKVQQAQNSLKAVLDALKFQKSAVAMRQFLQKLWRDMIEQLESALHKDGWPGKIVKFETKTGANGKYSHIQLNDPEKKNQLNMSVVHDNGNLIVNNINVGPKAVNTARVLREEFSPEAYILLASQFVKTAEKEEKEDKTESLSNGHSL